VTRFDTPERPWTSRLTQLMSGLSRAVWWFRQVLGDAAYDNYLQAQKRLRERENDMTPLRPLSAEEFYLDSIQRQFSKPNRCC
jgi:uncharacterized short protein YbdD (DUF466 family)